MKPRHLFALATTLLYFVTAGAIALHALRSMVMVVCGNVGLNPHPLSLTALAGAGSLAVAALLLWFRPYAAALIAIIGCMGIMLFESVGMYFYIRMMLEGEDYFDILLFIPLLLVLSTTALALSHLFKARQKTPVEPPSTDDSVPIKASAPSPHLKLGWKVALGMSVMVVTEIGRAHV